MPDILSLPVALAACAVLVMLFGYWHPSFQSIVELPTVLSLQDPTLYTKDFYVQSMRSFGPRVIYYRLLLLPTHFGLSLTSSYFLLFLAALLSVLAACLRLARILFLSPFAAAVLVTALLFTAYATLGASFVLKPEPIPSVLAMGFAVWGMVSVLEQRFSLAVLLFFLAALLQVLVGFLGLLLFVPAGLVIRRERFGRRELAKPLLLLLTLFGPFLGALWATDPDGTLSGREFVALYANLRHPHHLVPSSWPMRIWIQWGFLSLSGLAALGLARNLPRDCRILLGTAIVLVAGALILNYLFVERLPFAPVAALQLARLTPFSKIAAITAIAAVIGQQVESRKLGSALLLSTLLLTEKGQGPLLLVLTFLWARSQHPRLSKVPAVLLVASGGALLGIALFLDKPASLAPHLSVGMVEKTIALGCLWSLTLLYLARDKFLFASSLAAAAAAALFFFVPKPLERVRSDFTSYYRDFDATVFAEQLQAGTPKNAVLLVPPMRFEFRLFAQRSIVVDFLAFPYRKDAMAVWLERILLLTPAAVHPHTEPTALTPWQDAGSLFPKLSTEELLAAAHKTGADFIVTRDDWHQNLNREKVHSYNGWSAYRVR